MRHQRLLDHARLHVRPGRIHRQLEREAHWHQLAPYALPHPQNIFCFVMHRPRAARAIQRSTRRLGLPRRGNRGATSIYMPNGTNLGEVDSASDGASLLAMGSGGVDA